MLACSHVVACVGTCLGRVNTGSKATAMQDVKNEGGILRDALYSPIPEMWLKKPPCELNTSQSRDADVSRVCKQNKLSSGNITDLPLDSSRAAPQTWFRLNHETGSRVQNSHGPWSAAQGIQSITS